MTDVVEKATVPVAGRRPILHIEAILDITDHRRRFALPALLEMHIWHRPTMSQIAEVALLHTIVLGARPFGSRMRHTVGGEAHLGDSRRR